MVYSPGCRSLAVLLAAQAVGPSLSQSTPAEAADDAETVIAFRAYGPIDANDPRWAFDRPYRLGTVRADGTGETYLDPGAPEPQAWQPGPALGGERLVVVRHPDGETELLTTDLAGGDEQVIVRSAGYAYCHVTSPDGGQVAYHNAGPNGYEIYVVDLATRGLVLVDSHPDYLYFGPAWSPDEQWLVYQRCAWKTDPAHERSDLCLAHPDGTGKRLLTTGMQQWFATSFGSPETKGDGSNMPVWSPDGRTVIFTRCLPGSRTAWEHYDPSAERPDDHFNRDYKPELASGGTEICLLDIETGEATPITHDAPPLWNWRAAWSPDGKRIAFVRAEVGQAPELWVMDADGSGARFLTRGAYGLGADFPKWVTAPAQLRNQEAIRHIEEAPVEYPIRFAFTADTAYAPEGMTYQETIYRTVGALPERPRFFMALGDFAGPGSPERHAVHCRLADDLLGTPCLVALGNHDLDVGLDEGLQRFRELYGPENYTFAEGNTRFVVLAAADLGAGPLPGALDYLEETLAADTHPVRVVLLHIPPNMNGHFAPESQFSFQPDEDRFLSLCDQFGVSLVCCGHWLGYDYTVRGGIPVVTSGGGVVYLKPDQHLPPSRTHHANFVEVSIDEDGGIGLRVAHEGSDWQFDPAFEQRIAPRRRP